MYRETVDESAPASLRVKRTTVEGPRSYRHAAEDEGRLVIEVGATRSLWLLIALVLTGTVIATAGLLNGGNIGAACFLVVFGGLSAGVLGLLRGRGEVDVDLSGDRVKITTRTLLTPSAVVDIELPAIHRLAIFETDAGHSIVAQLEGGRRVFVVDELADRRTANYLAELLAEEIDAARKRALRAPEPAFLAEPAEDPRRASRRRRP